MVRAWFSKALFLSAIPIICLILPSSCQNYLRPPSNIAIRGYEKLDSKAFLSVAHQIKKLHHIRNQRHVDTGKLFKDHGDVWVLENLQNLRGCPKAVHRFKVFQNAGDWYAVIATSAKENNTEIYQFTALGCGKLLETLPTRLAFDFEMVRTNDVICIVVLENNPLTYPHKRIGSTVYTALFESSLNISIRRREVLLSERPTCVTTWEQFGIPHVAICNGKTKDFRGIESYRTKSYIYCASGGYFDRCGEIDTHFPQTIKHFRIFSKYYLAVANYPNETEAEDVPTEILRYNLGSKSYQHLQFLPTKGAKDLCFLNIGSGLNSIQFLITVNQLSFDSNGKANHDAVPHVYQFVGEKFQPFQTLPLKSKPTGCVAYQNGNGEAAIIFSTSWGVDIYQYNGWRFIAVFQYSKFALGAGISHLGTAMMDKETFITVANSNPLQSDSDNLFIPIFSRRINNTLTSVYNKSLASCHQMRTELKDDPIGLIVGLYSQAVKKNDTVIRLDKVDFKLLSTQRIFTNQIENKSNMTRLGATQISQLQSIAIKMSELDRKLQALTQRYKLAMRMNGDYIIHGRVHAKSIASTCRGQGCKLGNLTANTVNSVDIANVYQKSVLLTEKMIPPLKFKRLVVQHHINTTSLSNHDINDYVQVDENNNFPGRFKIVGDLLLVNGRLNVSGLVDECSISSDTLLLRKGNQSLNWTLKATNARLNDLKVHLINDQDIRHLYQNAISTTANFTLIRPKFFSSLTASNLFLSGLINKVNLTSMENSSMKLSGDQVVLGIHAYKAANLGSAILIGSLNGKQFPKEFISVREKDKLKLNKLQLDRNTAFAHLAISENIAGMQVTRGQWGSNLLNKSSNFIQVVSGKKNVKNIGSRTNLLSLTLNKLPMDAFETDRILYGYPDELLVYDSLDVQGDVTFEKPLSVIDTEGIGLQLLEEKGVLTSTESFPPVRSLTLTNNVKIKEDISTGTLDGVPSSGFFTRNRNVTIVFNGRKTFNKTVSMNNTFTLLYTLNGYDLRSLWNESLKIEGNQTLSGSLLIKNDVDVIKLEAKYSQLVPLTTRGVLTGTKHFQNLAVRGHWFVDEVNVNGLINDVDVSTWPSDTVMKNRKHQLIGSQKSILSLTVRNAEVYVIDEMDVKHLLDVVIRNQPAVLHSNLFINGPFFSNRIVINGSIDEVHSDAPLHWLRNKVNQNLSGMLEVQGILNAKNFRQDTWMLNQVDLSKFLFEAIRTNESMQFSSLRFRHIVLDDLILGGLIQGQNITEDLILKDTDHLHRPITGAKSFSGSLVSESFLVTHEINGINPHEVCRTPIPPQNSKWVVFGNILIHQDIKMNVSLINDRNLKDLTHHLWLKEGNVRVLPKQNFGDVTMKSALPEKAMSNISLSDLNLRSVKLSPITEQRITALHRFQAVQASGILAVQFLNSSWINGVNMKYLVDSVLLRDTEQTISSPITFQDIVASNVTINGMLNGVDVNTSLMRNDRLNVITGRKSINALKVIGGVESCDSCLVGTYDISNWASRVVLRKGNFTLSGAQFESLIFQQPLNLSGSLNNITVNQEQVLTLSDKQEIIGMLSVSSLLPDNILYANEKGPIYQQATEEFNVAARFNNLQVNGLYDGISLPHFYEQLVRRDMDIVFSDPVVLSRLTASSLYDSSTNSTVRDIIELPLNGSHHLATVVPPEVPIKNVSISTLVKEIDRVISRQSIELKFFEETPVSQKLPPVVDAIFVWESHNGEIEMCSFVEENGELFYGSSSSSLLTNVHVTGVSSLKETEDFAVAALDRTERQKHDSFLFTQVSPRKMKKQTIPTDFPIDVTAFLLYNQTCFLFLEKTSKSPIYCRLLGSNGTYTSSQHLATVNARLVTVSNHYSTGLPILVISSVAQRGHGHITVWNFNITSKRFEPWKKIITLQIVAMDSICNQDLCLLATVAPSKPAAIPGQVIIWSLIDDGPPKRLQRIAFTEPIDVKFTRLPDGRITLMILQSSGVDNVSVYIWRGLLQFQPETTVRVPGAQDLQLVSGNGQLVLALTVASSVPEVPYGPVRMFRANFLGQFN